MTGRELADLERVFPGIDIFDKIVAENGALLYTPATERERVLAPPPSPEFVALLEARGVDARCRSAAPIVATWEPHETVVLEVIKELGLELEIIFNKGAVMVLPSGVNKATGLAAALEETGLSAHNVVGVGDAENDHAFLRAVGYGVAVANALPELKETADRVTQGRPRRRRGRAGRQDHRARCRLTRDRPRQRIAHRRRTPRGGGEPVAAWRRRAVRRHVGHRQVDAGHGADRALGRAGIPVLRARPRGRLRGAGERRGGRRRRQSRPAAREIFDLLSKPSNNVAVNMLGLKTEERPDYFAKLLPELAGLRARTGRPHWLIIDEAHHLLPAARDGASRRLPKALAGAILITVHPDLVSPDVLAGVETVMALGPKADKVIAAFCKAIGEEAPARAGAAARQSAAVLEPVGRRRRPIASASKARSRRASGTSANMPRAISATAASISVGRTGR